MRFPISSLIFICISGIMLFLFVMFNYAFFDPSVGVVPNLNVSANQTMSGGILSTWHNQTAMLRDGFGISSCLCFVIGVVIYIADLFGRREEY